MAWCTYYNESRPTDTLHSENVIKMKTFFLVLTDIFQYLHVMCNHELSENRFVDLKTWQQLIL